MYKIITTILFFVLTQQILLAQVDFSQKHHLTDQHLTRLDSAITAGKYERITSVIVAKEGKVLYEKYYNGAAQESLHNTRSATKTLATLLTGIAIDKGYVKSEKDKIFSYLQHKMPVQNPDKRKEDITIEDLLSMSSIMECDDNNNFSRGNEERMYIIEDWTKFFLDLPVRSYPWGPKPKDRAYGRAFSYCTAGAAAVAVILESAIKMKLDQFAKKNLFSHLEIEKYKLHYNPEGTLNTAGGSEYRSRDLLKLIQMCLNKGQWKGKQIIAESWIAKATTPKAEAFGDLKYGYLFWLKDFGKNKEYKSYYMSGNGGQKAMAIPSLGVTLVITTTNYGKRNAHNYTDEIVGKYIIPAFKP